MIPSGFASIHVEERCYLAGGRIDWVESIANLRKMSPAGLTIELMKMPKSKDSFGTTFSSHNKSFFTVGAVDWRKMLV